MSLATVGQTEKRTVWISVDDVEEGGGVYMHLDEPRWLSEMGQWSSNDESEVEVCQSGFTQVTGILVAPGQCIALEQTFKVLGIRNGDDEPKTEEKKSWVNL